MIATAVAATTTTRTTTMTTATATAGNTTASTQTTVGWRAGDAAVALGETTTVPGTVAVTTKEIPMQTGPYGLEGGENHKLNLLNSFFSIISTLSHPYIDTVLSDFL
jgi:hypothetical protein